jgi:hypothetical protein
VHRHLVPSVISRGTPRQAISETSVSEERKRARDVRGILPTSSDFHDKLQGSLTCRKSATWDRRLYFPNEGRHAEDFSPEKSDGFGRVQTRDLGVPEASIIDFRGGVDLGHMELSDATGKIPSDTTGHRSRDLPTSSAVP